MKAGRFPRSARTSKTRSRGASISISALSGPTAGDSMAAGARRNLLLLAEPGFMDESTDCFICGRIPLVGEEVTVVSNGARETSVCDPCLPNPRVEGLGEPVRRDRIRSAEGAATVRRLIPVPVAAATPAPHPNSLPIEA